MKIGILFDLDGTLLDTLEDLYISINHVLKTQGYPERSRTEVRRFVGNGAYRLMEQAIPEGADVDKALDAFLTHYNATCNGGFTAPYPGISEMLEEVKKTYSVAVVSNKPDAAVKSLCEKYFPGIPALGVTDEIPRKPAPDMVYKTMEVLGVDRCIYVGDSEVDVFTAKAANVPCISVLWGFRDKEEIEAVGGKTFCTEASQIPTIIEEIVKALQ